jgi:hypothetical protein
LLIVDAYKVWLHRGLYPDTSKSLTVRYQFARSAIPSLPLTRLGAKPPRSLSDTFVTQADRKERKASVSSACIGLMYHVLAGSSVIIVIVAPNSFVTLD